LLLPLLHGASRIFTLVMGTVAVAQCKSFYLAQDLDLCSPGACSSSSSSNKEFVRVCLYAQVCPDTGESHSLQVGSTRVSARVSAWACSSMEEYSTTAQVLAWLRNLGCAVLGPLRVCCVDAMMTSLIKWFPSCWYGDTVSWVGPVSEQHTPQAVIINY
jgi:hypothetical protein